MVALQDQVRALKTTDAVRAPVPPDLGGLVESANDNIAVNPPQAQRVVTWRVAGILFLIAAEAILYGYSYPFFSLALEKRDLANWLIGLNASLAGAGILIVGPFLPRLIAHFGLKQLVTGLFTISVLSFGAILVADHIAVWFAARFVMGACFAALWTTTEIWLNGVVDDRHRGRVMGSAVTLYAGAQFIGPLALGAVGVGGSLPLLVAMLPLAAGAVVALLIPGTAGRPRAERVAAPEGLRAALSFAGPLIVAAFLAGLAETAMQGLLPIYGLAHGMTDAEAARLVAMFSFGEMFLVALLGWMADRYGFRLTLRLCAIPAIIAAVLLPLSVNNVAILAPALFLAGGVITGIYTLGLILIGHDFRGQRLAVVSTGFAMAYSAGAVVGSTPVGFAIDLFGPAALPTAISAAFVGLIVFLLLPRSDARPVVLAQAGR